MKKLIWPDYKNCIANLPNSILKKYGAETVGDTLPLLDGYLDKDYKNIVVILLDGMGKSIVEEHLEEDGPFRSHLAGIYDSVFLSTTVAATTSVLSGLQPCEHSWLGWDCYYPSIDKNVTVFSNNLQGTEIQAAPYNVAQTVTPYENIIRKINNAGKKAYMLAPFMENGPQNFIKMCDRIKILCDEPEVKYIYAYWNKPDGVLHRFGCKSPEARANVRELEQAVNELAGSVEDTLIIVTADHGHIDTRPETIQAYPQIYDCLVRKPSLEARVLNLFVKEGRKEVFEREFNKAFGDKFLLMPMEEVLEKRLFGTGREHKEFRKMLGDYLAIAIDDVALYFNDERFISMHGSVTEEEMLIPLIVF